MDFLKSYIDFKKGMFLPIFALNYPLTRARTLMFNAHAWRHINSKTIENL